MTSEFVAVDMNSKDDTSSSSSVAAGFNGSTGLIERAPHEKSDTEFKSSMNYLNESKRNEHYDMQYHMKAGCGTKETNKYWCSNRDTCGVICGSVTWILLVFAEICVVFVVLDVRYKDMFGYDIVSHIESADIIDADHAASSNHGDDDFSGYSMKFKFLNAAFYSLFIILALTSHLRAMFTNPGATPHDAVPLEYNGSDNIKIQQERYCKYCDAYKPPRAHHCSICGRCIVKMDHHCPWVNNCVGVGNQKYFVLFLLYTFTSCFYTLVLIIYKVGHCSGSRARYDMHGNLRHEPLNYHECGLNVTKATMQLLVAIEAVLFGLFTFCMMCDQWSMAVFAETQIDRLKGGRRKGRKWTKCENLSEVFGGPPRFSFWWLLPVKFAYLNPDRVYGFRTRDRRPSLSDSSSIGQDGTSSLPAFNQNDVHSQLVPKASKEFIDPESQSDTRFESKRDD